jgi:hypothetical protein
MTPQAEQAEQTKDSTPRKSAVSWG